MATETRDERRAAMPVSSRAWDDFTEAFGTLAEFHAYESGREIHWVPTKPPSVPPE